MAEQVQAALDQMVAPLRDLMDRNIFSQAEVRAIVRRRRESEYLLRRLTARKADFLRYIEAEQALEKLRKLRTSQIKRDFRRNQNGDTTSHEKQTKHIGDVHIIQHLHMLFVRAIRKFRSDLSLHLLHADFCKQEKSWSRLGRVYAEALQIFPRKDGLWIEAASHEFFGPTRSIRSARILLQRGLRLNKHSEDMWVEYFSLELHYAQTLRGRRKILHGEKVDSGENSDDDYKIARIVYNNAVKAIPDSIEFRLRFLDTCQRFPFTNSFTDDIQLELRQEFESRPEAWVTRALYEAKKLSNSEPLTRMEMLAEQDKDSDDESATIGTLDRPAKKRRRKNSVISILEESLIRIPQDQMRLHAFNFARSYLDELRSSGQEADCGEVEKFIDQLMVQSSESSSPEYALDRCDFDLENGRTENAVQTIRGFCTSKKNVPAMLWIRWGALCPKDAISIFRRALGKIPIDEADHVIILLQYFGSLILDKTQDGKELFSTFQRILVLAPNYADLVVENIASTKFGIESVAHSCLKYLEFAEEFEGLEKTRKIYTVVLFHSTVEVNENNVTYLRTFIDKCIQLERKSRSRLRQLYDKAVHIFEGTTLEELYREERDEKAIYL